MRNLRWAVIALAASLALPLAQANADTIGADDPLREAKRADRERVIELNTAQSRYVTRRDQGRTRAPTPAAQSRYRSEQERYRAAQAQHQADMAAWKRRVSACRNGDWSQCDR